MIRIARPGRLGRVTALREKKNLRRTELPPGIARRRRGGAEVGETASRRRKGEGGWGGVGGASPPSASAKGSGGTMCGECKLPKPMGQRSKEWSLDGVSVASEGLPRRRGRSRLAGRRRAPPRRRGSGCRRRGAGEVRAERREKSRARARGRQRMGCSALYKETVVGARDAAWCDRVRPASGDHRGCGGGRTGRLGLSSERSVDRRIVGQTPTSEASARSAAEGRGRGAQRRKGAAEGAASPAHGG